MVNVRGAWDNSASTVERALAPAPAGSATTVAVAETSSTNNWDVLLGRWVSDPLKRSGTFEGTVEWVAGVLESNTNANMYYHVHVWVAVGETSNLRGTLLSDNIGATEWPTSATGRGEGAKTLTPVAVQAGDRVVFEIGYRAQNTSTTSYTGTLHYGGTGTTDLTSGNTNVTTQPGWVEFSDPNQLWEDPPSSGGGSGQPPSVRTTSVAATISSSSFTVARPSGLQDDDVVVAFAVGDDATNSWPKPPTVTNWVAVGSPFGSNSYGWVQVYKKKANNEPANETWTGASNSSKIVIQMVLDDVDYDDLIDVMPTWLADTDGGTPVVAPSVDPNGTTGLLLNMYYTLLDGAGTGFGDIGGGAVELADTNDGSGYIGAAVFATQLTSGDPTGTRSSAVAAGTDASIGGSMVIKSLPVSSRPLEELQDAFDTPGDPSPVTWPNNYGPHDLTVVDGVLEIDVADNPDQSGGVGSAAAYTLVDSSATVKIVPPMLPDPESSTSATVARIMLYPDGNYGAYIGVYINSTAQVMWVNYHDGSTIAWSSGGFTWASWWQFVRISESGGKITFEVRDSNGWAAIPVQLDTPALFQGNTVELDLDAYWLPDEGETQVPGPARFDVLNVPFGAASIAAGYGDATPPALTVAVEGGIGQGAGDAPEPGRAVASRPGGALGTGTAPAPTADVQSEVQVLAGPAFGVGTAAGPAKAVSVAAEMAEADGEAFAPEIAASAEPGTAAAAGEATAVAAGIAVEGEPGVGEGAGTGGAPSAAVTAAVEAAEGAGEALAVDVSTSQDATAGTAAGTGSAMGLSISVGMDGTPGYGEGAGDAGEVTAEVTAHADTATGAADASDVTAEVTAELGVAEGAGDAVDAAGSSSLVRTPDTADADGEATDLEVVISVAPEDAAAMGRAQHVSGEAVAETTVYPTVATGTGHAGEIVVSTSLFGDAAPALGAGTALDAASLLESYSDPAEGAADAVDVAAEVATAADAAAGAGAASPAGTEAVTEVGVAAAAGAAGDVTPSTSLVRSVALADGAGEALGASPEVAGSAAEAAGVASADAPRPVVEVYAGVAEGAAEADPVGVSTSLVRTPGVPAGQAHAEALDVHLAVEPQPAEAAGAAGELQSEVVASLDVATGEADSPASLGVVGGVTDTAGGEGEAAKLGVHAVWQPIRADADGDVPVARWDGRAPVDCAFGTAATFPVAPLLASAPPPADGEGDAPGPDASSIAVEDAFPDAAEGGGEAADAATVVSGLPEPGEGAGSTGPAVIVVQVFPGTADGAGEASGPERVDVAGTPVAAAGSGVAWPGTAVGPGDIAALEALASGTALALLSSVLVHAGTAAGTGAAADLGASPVPYLASGEADALPVAPVVSAAAAAAEGSGGAAGLESVVAAEPPVADAAGDVPGSAAAVSAPVPDGALGSGQTYVVDGKSGSGADPARGEGGAYDLTSRAVVHAGVAAGAGDAFMPIPDTDREVLAGQALASGVAPAAGAAVFARAGRADGRGRGGIHDVELFTEVEEAAAESALAIDVRGPDSWVLPWHVTAERLYDLTAVPS